MQPGDDLIPFDDVMNALYEIVRREQFTVPLEVVDSTNDGLEVDNLTITVLAHWTWLREQKLETVCGYEAREHSYVVNSASKEPIYCSITAINNCRVT